MGKELIFLFKLLAFTYKGHFSGVFWFHRQKPLTYYLGCNDVALGLGGADRNGDHLILTGAPLCKYFSCYLLLSC